VIIPFVNGVLRGAVVEDSTQLCLLQAELDRFVNALISIREEIRDIESGKQDK
jgi:glycine cleavage system protein P-like pyridoxal-binding family